MPYSKDEVGKYVVEVLDTSSCVECEEFKWLIHDKHGEYIGTAHGYRVDPELARSDGIRFADELGKKKK